MHYFLYPTKDTTISNDPSYVFKNMGLDEILEVEKRTSNDSCSSTISYTELVGYISSSCELLSGSMSASYDSGSTDPNVVSSSYEIRYTKTLGPILSRALLQFDLSDISDAISSGSIVAPKFYLNLKVCESVEIPTKYTLYAYPVSQSWDMGTGYKYDGSTSTDGANWKFTDGNTKQWYSASLLDCNGGGVWWTNNGTLASGSGFDTNYYVSGSYSAKQYFDYQSSDVKMEITSMVMGWINEEIVNNGIVIMHSDESSSIDYGKLRFFSKETNTIYSPYIDVAWDDSSITTGSADPIQIRDAVVNMKNMAEKYKFGSIIRMDVTARKRYPVKTFTNRSSDYLAPYYLPSASYYQIKDAESENTVIPYDEFTKLSFDGNGNYFMLDTTCLPQERYFKVEIRSEQSGSIMTYTVPTAFKISR
jgi:hypothetical protein